VDEGARVRLKSGGPEMVVCPAFPGDGPDEVRCRWLSQWGDPLYGKLNFKVLVCPIDGSAARAREPMPLFDGVSV
jgi:uncharacterized protein YodC (DUF2158 family)